MEREPFWAPPPAQDAPVEDWLAWHDLQECPRWCGIRTTKSEKGLYECILEHSPIGLNFNGAVNGAVTIAIADHCVGAVAARELLPAKVAVTAVLDAQFHRPATLPLTFRAVTTGTGRALVFAQVEVFDSTDRICLRSVGTMAVRDAPPAGTSQPGTLR